MFPAGGSGRSVRRNDPPSPCLSFSAYNMNGLGRVVAGLPGKLRPGSADALVDGIFIVGIRKWPGEGPKRGKDPQQAFQDAQHLLLLHRPAQAEAR